MNKLEKIAELKFNGDERKAIEYLFSNEYDEAKRVEVVNDMNPKQINMYLKYKENEFKYPGGLSKFALDRATQEKLNLTTNEIKNMKVDNYKKEINKSLVKLLLVNGAFVGGYALSNGLGMNVPLEGLGVAAAAINSLLSVNCAGKILSYFDYKKMKERYNSPEAQEYLEKADLEDKYANEDESEKEKGL